MCRGTGRLSWAEYVVGSEVGRSAVGRYGDVVPFFSCGLVVSCAGWPGVLELLELGRRQEKRRCEGREEEVGAATSGGDTAQGICDWLKEVKHVEVRLVVGEELKRTDN